MRRNRSQTAKRRSHHSIAAGRMAKCECGAQRMPHRACPACGKYRGRVVIDMVARVEREQRRVKRRAKALRESGQVTEDTEKETAKSS